jgi:group I intron endonuclease
MAQETSNEENMNSSVVDEVNELQGDLKDNVIKKESIHYIYKITNKINNKIYIGQTVQLQKRWYQHKLNSKKEIPTSAISCAIKKYGVDNFEFEAVACCMGYDAANDAEEQIIKDYDCLVQNEKGYNIALGGYNAPKSELWKQSVKKWRNSLSEEEKNAIRDKISDATKKQIKERGHPAEGNKWTEDQKKKMSEWRSSINKDDIYTPEVRKKMSESHKGKPQPRELVEKRMASVRIKLDKKMAERYQDKSIKCHAEGCEISGRNKYSIVNGIRYCKLHGSRLKRNGHLEIKPKLPVQVTEETRKKISMNRKGKGVGRVPHNKMELSREQIEFILSDSRSIIELSKIMKIGRKVISRIRRDRNKFSA